MTFRVGQKVVCVDARCNPRLIQDAVYTISGITNGGFVALGLPSYSNRDDDEIHLAEVAGHWCGFYASRFRPAVESKSSISFTMGAPKDSEKFDNRKKQKERV